MGGSQSTATPTLVEALEDRASKLITTFDQLQADCAYANLMYVYKDNAKCRVTGDLPRYTRTYMMIITGLKIAIHLLDVCCTSKLLIILVSTASY